MQVFSNLIKKYKAITAKQFVIAGVFSLAFAGAIGMGLATRTQIHASVIRDTNGVNSIDGCDRNGGIGAEDVEELIKDINDPKCPRDLAGLYDHFGVNASNYRQAVQGEIRRNGDVVVNGEIVMKDVWTMGRTTLNGIQREPITINGVTYYHSPPSVSFNEKRQSLPAMVWFDENGEAMVAIMNACGNVGYGVKVENSVTCKALNATQPDKVNKPNTWNFTTSADHSVNAHISKVVYTFSDDNTTITKTGADALTQVAEHTFKKDGTVTTTVYATVPGGHEIHSVIVENCKRKITYVAPFFVCEKLLPVAIDKQERSFRFTAKTKQDATTTLVSVDFALDGTDITKAVTTKDGDGFIYKEYSFNDEKQHTIVATVNFSTREGVKSADCQAKVTPKELPKCTVPGKENLPPDSPECGYCKPGVPIGSKECSPPQECKPGVPVGSKDCAPLVKTGPGDTLGLFAGTSVLGAVGHRIVTRRRNRRTE